MQPTQKITSLFSVNLIFIDSKKYVLQNLIYFEGLDYEFFFCSDQICLNAIVEANKNFKYTDNKKSTFYKLFYL